MAATAKLEHDDLLKLKAVVLYIVNKCGPIDYFHIFKILYFADREHFAHYGRRIVEDTFCALENGPVPSTLFDAIKITVGQIKRREGNPLNIISDSLQPSDSVYSYYLSAKENPDMDELSKSDIACIDNSIKENRDISFGVLSKKSHDAAWSEAWNRKNSSPIDELSMARAGGANDAMLDYIKEVRTTDFLLRQI